MAIAVGYQKNLSTIMNAAKHGDLGLMECTDKVTGSPVVVITAFYTDEDGMINAVPLGRMFDGNPYDELNPPA